ncbi:MAG: valine--tRNA ligase [Sphingorhabdus sp.]|jgi:valyl-tRNA synthetase|uniref:valine--tRNA ligase n=2 Tax=Sphingorhabdus sp. TaxID=1902408 RepID=UPI0027401D87|nr:valine--tRNA ligase [Sphingorhabdus sp.]MDP4756971.1 valine--tRNA ligase [Sphingorhabdus sp.]MDP4874151.1 valine--tRNA ligase [Sphingorhabdus sp.]MDP4927815.1 valine--tRNA ligase [Sphingorhabdus sp.]
MTIDKTFDPAAIEAKWYTHWESTGAFRPERPDAEPYTIVNPPPNVTGSLHIGHALDNTLQDILIRHARLQGKDALWVVGTDHAGIATQMVVERQLNARQQKRTDFTREEFIAKVWEWKTESGGEITGQLRRLGCSMDWENERFTMDEGFSKAVIKVFVDLYNQKLLYRDKRLVNWDPGLKTAISDLEVETREINGKFWHFKYPLEDGSGFISVATTRPETMLADMAVAVNSSDKRYAHMVGKNVRLPITGRLIPIVTDEHADPELGSGAVKITPGHDFNDFEVGKRAGFKASDMFNMLDGEGRVVQTADGLIPAEYIGQYRFGIEGEPTNARKMVVAALDALGLLEKVEDRVIQTPFGDRSGQVIEPWLTDQWYVDAETLAKPAIEAARKGKANGGFDIVPKSWEKTYFNWMENIQPWCVSRQLWWGHQIPAWFATDGTCYVAETEEAAQLLAGAGVALTRDPDVLDTWFSSALWPFGTLGWPDQNTMLDRHYPNDVLISGFDILFFWDARMAMQGIHFMEEVPWKTLYLHGLVRAADGSKMSKSKGNTVDPLGLIDQYGADALRFFMAAMESQGRDIKMDESRVAGYRNFATKLWNAARFAQSNGIGGSRSVSAPKAELAVNRWIIGEVVSTVEKLNKAFAEFRFDGMADVIYHFVFDQFCDWYLELLKPILQAQSDDDGAEPQPSLANADADEAREVAGWALDQILVMLHPFMPFITEELWHAMSDPAQPRAHDIIHAQWPEPNATIDADAVAEINWVIDTISKTRSFKAELNIPPGTRLTANIADPQVSTMSVIARQAAALSRLGRIDSFVYAPVATNNVAQIVVGGDTVVFALDDVIDLDAERSRITKALEAARKERDALAGRLSNAAFVEKAKPEAVEKARADHAEKAAEAERLTVALARLG